MRRQGAWSADVQLRLLLQEVRVSLMPLKCPGVWYYNPGREHLPQQELQSSALLEHWARGVLLLAAEEGSVGHLAQALSAMAQQLIDLRDGPAAYLASSPSLSYLLSSHLVGLCAALDGGTTYGMPAGPGAAVAPLFTASGQWLQPGATEELGVGLALWACSMWTETLGNARKLLYQSWAELSLPAGGACAGPAGQTTATQGDALPAPPPPPQGPSAAATSPGLRQRPMPLRPALRDCLRRLEHQAAAMQDQQQQEQQQQMAALRLSASGADAGPSGPTAPAPSGAARALAIAEAGAAASEKPPRAVDPQGSRADQAGAQQAAGSDAERLGARAEELRGLLGGRTLMPLNTRAAFSVGMRLAASCVEALLANRQATGAAAAAAGMGPAGPRWRPRLAPAGAAVLGVKALCCAAAACAEAASLPYSQAPPAALRPLVSLAKTRLAMAAAVADLGPLVLQGRDELLSSALKLWQLRTPGQEGGDPEQLQKPSAGLVTSLAAGYMRSLEAAMRSSNRDLVRKVTDGTAPYAWTQALALTPPREAASLLASLAKVLRRESAGLLEAMAARQAVSAVAPDSGGSGGGSEGRGGSDSSGDGGEHKARGLGSLWFRYIDHATLRSVAKCFLGLGSEGWGWLRRAAAAEAGGGGGAACEASAADSRTASVAIAARSMNSMPPGSDVDGAPGRCIGTCGVAGGNAGRGSAMADGDGGGQTGAGGVASCCDGGSGSGTCGSSSDSGAGARFDTRSALSGRALARSASYAAVHLGPVLSYMLRCMRACDEALGEMTVYGQPLQRKVATFLLSLVPVLALAAAADTAGSPKLAATGTGLGCRDGGIGQGGDSSESTGDSGDGAYDSSSGADGGGIAGAADGGSSAVRGPLSDMRQFAGDRQHASATAMAAAEWRRFLLCGMGIPEVLSAALGLVSTTPDREQDPAMAGLRAALCCSLRALACLLPGELARMLAAEGQVEAAEAQAVEGEEAEARAKALSANAKPPSLSQLRALLGPGGSMADPELLAAVEAACGGDGDGSRAVGAGSIPLPADLDAWAPLAALLVPPSAVRAALPVCSNPLCTNLEGDSEAALRLRGCAGCGEVARYCSRSCQVAHWRAGHSKECAGKGRAATASAVPS